MPPHDEFSGNQKVSLLNTTVMMIMINRPWLGPVAAAVFLYAANVWAADDASRWDGDARSAVRLIAGSRANDGKVLGAGIEIRLKPGWHTYWRYPGDAGVPPTFDFKGSQNLREVEVLWPAPQRLVQDGGVSIGYEHHVVLPLRILAEDGARPVLLRLKLDYAICEKLCVPAQAGAELALPVGAAAQNVSLAAAVARVPRQVVLGEGAKLAILSVRRESGGGRPRLLVDVATEDEAVDLFAEGPTPNWALPVPSRVDGAPVGVKRFAFELDGAPPGGKYEGALITLTAVATTAAIEVPIRLD